MDRDPGLQAMQDIIDRMTREGASQEDIDAALMEFAYRHEHEKDDAAVNLPGLPEDADWREHMRADIANLVCCGYIYMLKGWELSKGAKLELDVASSCGIKVLFEIALNV